MLFVLSSLFRCLLLLLPRDFPLTSRTSEVPGSFWVGASTSQPAIFAHKEAGHEGGERRHCLWLILAELACKPLVPDTVSERGYGFGVRTIDYLVLFGQKLIPEL